MPAFGLAQWLYLDLVFRQQSGSVSDHGMSDTSTSSGTFPRGCFTNSVSRCLKYSYGFKLFAFALSAMLYKRALVFAPFIESMMCQECFPTQNALMLRSASLLSSGSCGSCRKHLRYCS